MSKSNARAFLYRLVRAITEQILCCRLGKGFVAVAIALTVAFPNDAQAVIRKLIPSPITSFQMELIILRHPANVSLATARALALIWDPVGEDVTGFSMSLAYDPLKYAFVPATSGPLGVFSAGGDAPTTNPGVGTQPVHELPTSGFTAGAPLPGSTLTYTNVNGLLTVNYVLPGPITVNTDVNFFRTDFEFLNPPDINVDLSTVTYHSQGPGSDFSLGSFSCTTDNLEGGCGSNNPSTGVTFNFAPVPEPSCLFLGLLACAAMATLRTRNRRDC